MSVIAFPTVAPFGTLADAPLKVLRPDLSQRIQRVNTARRVLMAEGVVVISQDLMNKGPRPRLHINGPLPRVLHYQAECVREHGKHTVALLGGVDVLWATVVAQ